MTMKKFIIAFILSMFALPTVAIAPNAARAAEVKKPMLAIVIDDFGEARNGVEKMLSIKAPLTCAIMPDLEFSTQDAEAAHKNGHEVILHMPLESKNGLPRSWYGPRIISNSDTPAKAKETFTKCLESVPHAVGANYHIGTGVSENKKLMTAIMEVASEKNIYFLDSKTTMHSACPDAAKITGAKFIARDLFLEDRGPSYNYAKKIINEAVALAKTQGYAVVIGHVGPMGNESTARAIADSIDYIKNENVEIVPLSKLINSKKV